MNKGLKEQLINILWQNCQSWISLYKGSMSYNKKYQTGFEKRTLSYTPQQVKQVPLELPEKFHSKITQPQYKKMKQSYFLMCNPDYSIDYSNFVKAIRSLGIVVKTATLYESFDPKKNKKINWEEFIEKYISLRSFKGSFKEVDIAIKRLDRQYKGRWQLFYKDLQVLGEVLTDHEMEVFKNEIIGEQILNTENLKNSLLGYK